jgi:hypothetical protein
MSCYQLYFYYSIFIHHQSLSIEIEITLESHELLGRVVLVVHTTPVHHALPIE